MAKTVCIFCKKEEQITREEALSLGLDEDTFESGVYYTHCDDCDVNASTSISPSAGWDADDD
jgi:hypothetical protein